MAVSHTTYVWSINNILPERKFALLVLADYAGQTFTEERAIVLINKYTGYSLEQSSEMIAALIQEGIHIQRWGDEFRIPAPDTMLPSLAKKPKSKSITRRFAKAVAERDGGWLCHYCGAKLLPPDDPALHGNFAICDHKLARHSGGTDALGNLVLACRRCNDRKGTKPYEQFLREIGR